MKSKYILWVFFLSIPLCVSAQSLLDKLEKEQPEIENNTLATFKANRLSISHSVETRKKNTLEISSMNRFWNIENSQQEQLIPDRISSRLGLAYGVTDKLTIGLGFGFGNPNGVFDTYVKYRLIQQTENDSKPISLTLLQTATYRANFLNGVVGRGNSFGEQLAYTSQALLARKITRNFSVQIAPTFIHRGSSESSLDDNNHFALGFGSRYKLTNHVSLVSEYYYVVNRLDSRPTSSPVVFGVNWEVSKVLLQFKMTNNAAFVEDTFIVQTAKDFNFSNGNFFFGFHAIYHFQL